MSVALAPRHRLDAQRRVGDADRRQRACSVTAARSNSCSKSCAAMTKGWSTVSMHGTAWHWHVLLACLTFQLAFA
jgi:hypothetical protein